MKVDLKNDFYPKQRAMLGETIKRLRGEKNMTQKELAELVGVARSSIARFEMGSINITLRYLIKIAEALEVEVKDLFEF